MQQLLLLWRHLRETKSGWLKFRPAASASGHCITWDYRQAMIPGGTVDDCLWTIQSNLMFYLETPKQ